MQIISKKTKSKLIRRIKFIRTLSVGVAIGFALNTSYASTAADSCSDALDYAYANFQDMRKIAANYQARLACYESVFNGLGESVNCKKGGVK